MPGDPSSDVCQDPAPTAPPKPRRQTLDRLPPSSTLPEKPQGLQIPSLLLKIKTGEVDVADLSRAAKHALAGFLAYEGYGSEQIAALLRAPARTVRYWRSKFDEDLAKEYRGRVDLVAGALLGTAARVKDRLREKGDWAAVWGVQLTLVDRLLKLGIVRPEGGDDAAAPLTLEEAFERQRDIPEGETPEGDPAERLLGSGDAGAGPGPGLGAPEPPPALP